MKTFLRTLLTGADNQSYDVVRLGLFVAIVVWAVLGLGFLAIEIFALVRYGHLAEPFATATVTHFGALGGLHWASSQGLKVKAATEPPVPAAAAGGPR
jgi:hypothetical protein